MILYHGTSTKFNKFSKSKIGSNTQVTSVGFFFTDNINTAQSYGDIVLKCEVELESSITCNFDGKGTYFFGEEKWYTPNTLAVRIDEINTDLINYGSVEIGDMNREEALDYLDYLGEGDGYDVEDGIGCFLHSADDTIDSIICRKVSDSFDLGGTPCNNYIVFDENNIKVLEVISESNIYNSLNKELLSLMEWVKEYATIPNDTRMHSSDKLENGYNSFYDPKIGVKGAYHGKTITLT